MLHSGIIACWSMRRWQHLRTLLYLFDHYDFCIFNKIIKVNKDLFYEVIFYSLISLEALNLPTTTL